MKILFVLAFACCAELLGTAQSPVCTDIPLSYDSGAILFTESDFTSQGDSMITVPLINEHPNQGFAYPQIKLAPLTALPDGMTLAPGSQGWNVFASSWNAQTTEVAEIYYDVSMPIPANYEVEFQLWVFNLEPVTSDSCYFSTTFTLNLNPAVLSHNEINTNASCSVFPNPTQVMAYVSWQHALAQPACLTLHDARGMKVRWMFVQKGMKEAELNMAELPAGIYVLHITGARQSKVVVIKE